MGGPGMGGGGAMTQAGAAGGGARGSGGGQAAQPAAAAAAVQETRHNIMPAQDLVLDARQWDRQLLDPSCGQLQLLRALMQVDAWEAAGLMLQWLQVSGEQATAALECAQRAVPCWPLLKGNCCECSCTFS